MSRFNLVDENWIPVRLLDRSRRELGIHDTLLLSREIEAIEDPSPLVVAALHRFLLAVLYRALEGPTDIEHAKVLFKNGLPSEPIKAYLEKWRDRFWLFDQKYPFGQNPNVPQEKLEPWNKLTAEYNATSNKVLFDHTSTMEPGQREPEECARWLLSTMTFSISGGRGYFPSPSPNAMFCLPLGKDFHQTLCYNLVPYPNREVKKNDSALWERTPKKLPLENIKRASVGYADLYTWQPRMIMLEELQSGGVAAMRFVAGQGFENPSNIPDPMQPYKVDRDRGRLPVQFREDRGAWRDFDSLLPDASELAPLTMQNAVALAGRKMQLMPRSVLVLGLRYEPPNANVDFWRMERFALPDALSGERNVRREIGGLLSYADDAQKTLWYACKLFACSLLSRGDREPAPEDARRFIQQMPVLSYYWSTLEYRFHEILPEYSVERDLDDIRREWLVSVRDSMKRAWEQHSSSVSTGDAWAIRALVKAEEPVRHKIRELNDEIVELAETKEGT